MNAIFFALLGLAALFFLVTADAANVLVTHARAQTAADAAALAAATSEWPFTKTGESAEQAAKDAATANGAKLVSCTCPLRGPTARVEVEVPTFIRMLGVAPSKVTATAEAKLDVSRIFQPQR